MLAIANVLSLRGVRSGEWADLIESVQRIPNRADQAFILAEIAELLPARERERREQLVERTLSIVSTLPHALERVEHYLWLARTAGDRNQQLAKKCLRSAISEVSASHDPENERAVRNVVDLADKIGPEFAAEIAGFLDTDPARKRLAEQAHKQIGVSQLRRSLIESRVEEPDREEALRIAPDAAWQVLRSLKAGRINAINEDRLQGSLRQASALPFERAYPIFSVAIESTCERAVTMPSAAADLTKVFHRSIDCARVVLSLCNSPALVPRSMPKPHNTMIIPAGGRELALEHLEKWVASNCRDYLKITDPYFGPEDLIVLMWVRRYHPDLKVAILTSRKHQDPGLAVDEAFRQAWARLSDEHSPATEIIVASTEGSGESPVHDRWWITAGSALDLGTSFRSIGIGKDAEISLKEGIDAQILEQRLDKYLNRASRDDTGRRLIYTLVTM